MRRFACCLVLLGAAGPSWAQPPNPPVLIGPSDGATEVSIAPTLEVLVSDSDSDPLTVTFYGRPAAPPPGEDFTIIAMPDTQHYTDNPANEAHFAAQTQWIAHNRVSRNIVFVTGLGDIVQNGNANLSEWNIADAAYNLIEDEVTTLLADGIPYGLSVGNHDQSPIGGGSSASTTRYNEFFGEARFSGREYYGGHFGADNDNSYQLFSAGSMDFIALHFEYDTTPEADVLNWASNLLATHGNRRAMASTHFLIGLGNPGQWGAQGLAIYNALNHHENLFLMLAGHVHGEGRRQDTGANGNVINTLLSDYQDYANGGNGFLRIMTFSPATNTIEVQTYSPSLDAFETDDSSQFTLSYDMGGGPPFQLIGINENVASDNAASMDWPGLDGTTEYEWFVIVEDGTSPPTTGATWRFTTFDPPPEIVPPNTLLTMTPADPSGTCLAGFAFTGTDNLTAPGSLTFECQLDGGAFGECTSPFNLDPLTEGPHTFAVRAIDGDANTDPVPASFQWTIDLSPHLQVRIAQGSDDAEERDSDGVMDLTSTDLELVHDSADASDVDQLVGMRFEGVGIPAGTVVLNAHIEFETDETSSTATQLTLRAQAADNPPGFTTTAGNISNRALTTTEVPWNPGAWNTESVKHQSPNLAPLLQEVVERPGWAGGNAILFVIEGSGRRVAESFNGEPENAPLLVVEYVVPEEIASCPNAIFDDGFE